VPYVQRPPHPPEMKAGLGPRAPGVERFFRGERVVDQPSPMGWRATGKPIFMACSAGADAGAQKMHLPASID